jgi:hypothetical protein
MSLSIRVISDGPAWLNRLDHSKTGGMRHHLRYQFAPLKAQEKHLSS